MHQPQPDPHGANSPSAPSNGSTNDITIGLSSTWSEYAVALIALAFDGNAEGKALAKHELKRMAAVADLAASAMKIVARQAEGLGVWKEHEQLEATRVVLASCHRDHGADTDRPEQSVDNGALADVEKPLQQTAQSAQQHPAYGVLAKHFCKREMPLQVLYSAAGFYLGTLDEGRMPLSRESKEFWPSRERARDALQSGEWTQRITP